jgi:hypothetical protein
MFCIVLMISDLMLLGTVVLHHKYRLVARNRHQSLAVYYHGGFCYNFVVIVWPGLCIDNDKVFIPSNLEHFKFPLYP